MSVVTAAEHYIVHTAAAVLRELRYYQNDLLKALESSNFWYVTRL